MWICRLVVTSSRSVKTHFVLKRSEATSLTVILLNATGPNSGSTVLFTVHHVWLFVMFPDVLKDPDDRQREYDRSPVWKHIWTFRWRLWSESASHTLHWNCRSFVYLKTCLWIFSYSEHWLTQFRTKRSFASGDAHASLSIIFYLYLVNSAIHVKKQIK